MQYSFYMYSILPAKDNPALREKARDIPHAEINDPKIQELIAEMRALLAKEEYGVALAAPQVGQPLRLFVVSGKALALGNRTAPDALPAGRQEQDKPEQKESPSLPDQIYINPTLTKLSRQKSEKHEGCLSLRGFWGIVPRAEKAMIRCLDENGEEITRGATGFLAHIFQHEVDHLEGILYTDKAKEIYEEQREA